MAALLALMVGCNKEPQAGPDEGLNSEDKVYMEFSIQTLTTRSGTGENGGSDANPNVEVGLDKENKISSVDVVLRNATTYVSATVTNPVEESNTDDDATTSPKKWIATFNSSQLTANTDYKVYIYANCSAKQDEDAVSTAAIAEMTVENKFWMTNAYEPGNANFKTFSTDRSNPTDLGTFYVERSMARFDYMPKGPYTLQEKDGQPTVQVTLTHAALINQSKAFYMLRRVSANGENTGCTVGGTETLANYVVDTDWKAKQNGYTAAQVGNFDYHMTQPSGWDWRGITADDLKQVDNWVGKDDGKTDYDGNHELNDYFIWQYCKENTIPGVDIQKNGISTGVVFKGKIEGAMVAAANGAPIYVYENVLYGTWDKVVAAAAQDNASESLKFAVSVCNNNGVAKDATTLAAAGFTRYSAVNEGTSEAPSYAYYAYYYYWNRHNDNADNQSMGQMEFAVVRNNVYKLCVDSIEKFGHPTPGGDDPDPDKPDPNDPDEEGEYYFKVSVKVLPWVVRVNHIEF